MKEYYVYVPEIWLTRFIVEAEDEEEALDLVKDTQSYIYDHDNFDQDFFEFNVFADEDTWYAEETKEEQ